MKDAHEMLAKLRAAGVEPVSDARVDVILQQCLRGQRDTYEWAVRFAADLLEARAKLAEVRDLMATDLRLLRPTSAAEVLEILDKEPTP